MDRPQHRSTALRQRTTQRAAIVEDDKALSLNQFQTDRSVAARLLQIVFRFLEQTLGGNGVSHEDLLFIEPSAGDGAFYDLLPEGQRVGIDIDPATAEHHPEYVIDDFLQLSVMDIPGIIDVDRRYRVIVGNPPYNDGQRFRGGLKNVALQFLNHASKMADTVAFLLGANFNRLDVQDKVADDMHLVLNMEVPEDWSTFEVRDKKYGAAGKRAKVRVVFQIWQRKYATGGPPMHTRAGNYHQQQSRLAAANSSHTLGADDSVAVVRRPKHKDIVPKITNGTWTHPHTGHPGDFEIVVPSDPSSNVCIRRWGVVGEVVDDPRAVAQLVRKAIEGEEDRRQRRPDIYSADYHMFRGTGSFFHLRAPDPGKVARALRQRAHMFADYAKSATPGNSGSFNQRDLLRIYLQPIQPPSV